MLLRELFNHLSEKQIWGRTGKKLVRKYRCTSGKRKGRIVSKVAQCHAAPNIKARLQMKKLQQKMGKRIARKSKRTKRVNPASVQLKRLNKRK